MSRVQSPMRSIRHKNALVTGAAAGIGRAIALQLAREGVHLYLLDVNELELASVVSAARRAGVNALGRYCDVSQPTHITRSVADALARWDKIDILVNNAGITYYGDTEKMSADDANRLLAINLHAPIQFTRELLPTPWYELIFGQQVGNGPVAGSRKYSELLAPREGIEPPTRCLEGSCSIRLSYRGPREGEEGRKRGTAAPVMRPRTGSTSFCV